MLRATKGCLSIGLLGFFLSIPVSIHSSSIQSPSTQASSIQASSALQELPALGHGSHYTISLHEERHLGQGWLRQFRSQAALYQDPLVQDYSENLAQRLAALTRGLDASEVEVLLVDQPQLNAFAVPGGILGINSGLFLFAKNEDELASVLAHELAHISQRHFARRVEATQGLQWSTLAGLLAGILVASQGHADAGVAAIAGTQAAAIQSQLAWSRAYEQEADRLGMETLAAADYAPAAMPAMFQQMQRLSSLQGRPPEFLMTHPLTASRLADAWARADQLASTLQSAPPQRIKGRDFELLRVRLIFHHEDRPEEALRFFLQESPTQEPATAAGRAYAQVLADQHQGKAAQALAGMRQLHAEHPQWLSVHFLLAETLIANKAWEEAESQLQALLDWSPGYYPARSLLADLHMQTQNGPEAYRLLQKLSQDRPDDPAVWLQLAEAAGKAGESLALHQARAEYFQLTGRFRQALSQLDIALQKARQAENSWPLQEKLRNRRQALMEARERMGL